jgi:hypothetical protein
VGGNPEVYNSPFSTLVQEKILGFLLHVFDERLYSVDSLNSVVVNPTTEFAEITEQEKKLNLCGLGVLRGRILTTEQLCFLSGFFQEETSTVQHFL